MTSIELLNFIYSNITEWNTSDVDPWDRQNGFELTIAYPDEPGVYLFKSLAKGDLYYIGKAERSLQGRLKGKLIADLKEKRVTNKWTADGKLIHHYPYLPRYVEDETMLYTISTPYEISPTELEEVLIAAYRLKYSKLPEGNFSGGKNLANSDDPEITNLLEGIAENLFLPLQTNSAKQTYATPPTKKPITRKMLKLFTSSIIRGGNVLTPERIIITVNDVTWKQRNKNLIGEDSITISRKNITSIEVNEKLLGADIRISSFGGGSIIGRNFTKSDCEEMRIVLNS